MKNIFIFTALLLGGSYLLPLNSLLPSSSFAKEEATANRNKYRNKPTGTVRIVIDKSEYQLYIYDDEGWYATYPVVFGNNSLSDKKYQGDKNTPEGSFKITYKKVHNKWSRFLLIDYPNKDSYEKFDRRKKSGEIPLSSKIGGEIGIHGTWPNEDYVIDRSYNWTEGCISMKNKHVEEIYSFTPVGTEVVIRK